MRHAFAQTFTPLQSKPIVSVDARHWVPNPVRTRLGVGETFIDHAAGMPLPLRRSSVARVPFTPHEARYPLHEMNAALAPSSLRSAPMPSNIDGMYALQAPNRGLDEPVDLPLRSSRTTYAAVAALVIAFVAVLATVVLAGGTTQASGAPNDVSNATDRAH
jgi:hypothetical protein